MQGTQLVKLIWSSVSMQLVR